MLEIAPDFKHFMGFCCTKMIMSYLSKVEMSS